ncbi:hypothetical protein Bca52824_023519 [Brassica carinata]|uniref:Uncharacterized protein n=1 Tax=Brassica carinata TaxID=52824 RepID=A0A8X8AUI4_BRACI|nr:hypothetical protein Bca52824_023519 [Brassica carinata]
MYTQLIQETNTLNSKEHQWKNHNKNHKNVEKAHPNYKKFRDETFEEFDDLKIIFERNFATGRNAIGLGDTTDARTTETTEAEKEQPDYKTMSRNHHFLAVLRMILWKNSQYERDKELILFIKLMIHPVKRTV